MEKFKTANESRVSITELMLPSHSNFGGKVHGGHILSLMDQIAFACASKHSQMYCVTASVNRVDFLHPVEVGELLTLRASINYTGRTSMVVGVRVESQDIKSGTKRHCNSSYFTMVAKDEDGRGVPIPGLLLDNEQGVRRFARSKKRKEEAFSRDTEFDSTQFKSELHLESLNGENVKLDLP
ncbi:acyl-CoA thioesterase [Zobellia nedashkovskayae]|uniref:Acyl-CoA thioesterase n=1 Tax=Zobellia barbeyronii TaxID=2748009 RepID=A0ABS5WCV1_9FLAO|nr:MULTISPECIES: acyl-CoA thioesterase [Zobellia]MBT2161069.1 acyl-CoA thioesterase [Zobellia barbeyronii]MUH39999.1 acyl-CoA thioesterase [Zobellia laminariae]WKX75350.1 acyl-CoA thioesterase [Zobellia laminariae]